MLNEADAKTMEVRQIEPGKYSTQSTFSEQWEMEVESAFVHVFLFNMFPYFLK